MIEQLMSRSLAGDHQGHAAGFVGLHVGPLYSLIIYKLSLSFVSDLNAKMAILAVLQPQNAD
jgi:hypothetical protein